MADAATLEHSGANGSATVSTKPPIKAPNPVDTPAEEGAANGHSDAPKTTYDEGDEEEVDDEYDFEVSAFASRRCRRGFLGVWNRARPSS